MSETDKHHHHGGDKGLAIPHKGDKFKCNNCPMTLEITADCTCASAEDVHFHCCGKEMVKA